MRFKSVKPMAVLKQTNATFASFKVRLDVMNYNVEKMRFTFLRLKSAE